MSNKYNWKICKRCQLPFIPFRENQIYCSYLCEMRLQEETRDMEAKTVICANCKKKIPAGEPYFIVGDNYLQMKYFDSAKDNIFCSHECICEALSVIEVPNDGSKTLDEEISGVDPDHNPNIVRVSAGVYPIDAWVNGEDDADTEEDENAVPKMPGLVKVGDRDYDNWRWNITIDIENGKILNWPQGTTAKTNYKPSDDCDIFYLGKKYSDNVPDFLAIFDDGYGDYIYIEVLEDGTIKDWDKKACKDWLKENYDSFEEEE